VFRKLSEAIVHSNCSFRALPGTNNAMLLHSFSPDCSSTVLSRVKSHSLHLVNCSKDSFRVRTPQALRIIGWVTAVGNTHPMSEPQLALQASSRALVPGK